MIHDQTNAPAEHFEFRNTVEGGISTGTLGATAGQDREPTAMGFFAGSLGFDAPDPESGFFTGSLGNTSEAGGVEESEFGFSTDWDTIL